MSWDTPLFHCVICQRDVCGYQGRGRDEHIEPVCRGCERLYTERCGSPNGGSLRDRRKAMQVLALSNALHNRASIIEWEAKYGRP